MRIFWKNDLARLKLDIGKLETIPVDLSKPSNLAVKEIIIKTAYHDLGKYVNAIYK